MKVKLVRSYIGINKKQKRNLKALGLRKINQVKSFSNTKDILGKINKVNHLVEVIEE